MKRRDVLPWNRFRYFAITANRGDKKDGVSGVVSFFGSHPTRDSVQRVCLESAASNCQHFGLPFNPFNISLIFVPA